VPGLSHPFPIARGDEEERATLTQVHLEASKSIYPPRSSRHVASAFFPRVTHRYGLRDLSTRWIRPEPSRLLTRLSTRGGHLPQGAPTSDRLANLHLSTADAMFESILSEFDLKGSAYVDDVTVSGVKTREAIPRLIAMLRTIGLGVSAKKVQNAGPRDAHSVTGYNTNGKTPTVGRTERARIRAITHEFIVASRHGGATKRLEHQVRTRLGQLHLTNPGEADRLYRQLLRNSKDLTPERLKAKRQA
jgi:hypothetical protein